MSAKTVTTDYYRAVINTDGSLTFFAKNSGDVILENSPLVYFNSEKLSTGNNVSQQFTSSGDETIATISDNENPNVTVTHLYRFNIHSPYIDYTITWHYKKEGYTSEERLDFIAPVQDAEVLTRDLRLIRFNPLNIYWSDLYTPKVIKFAHGLYFLGSDTMESMKIQAYEGKTRVSFYSDYSENHPHHYYVKGGGGEKAFVNETQRFVNDTFSASIQFAIHPGEKLHSVIKNRQPYGYDAVLLFTSHPDSWTIEKAKAVAYGSANENNPAFGSKGIVGRGLGWTHGTFKTGQWYSLEYQGDTVKKFIDRMYRDGVEIVPHSITPSADNRTAAEQGLATFEQYNTRNWIDHSASAGSDNFEDLASQGAIKGNEFYILDILAKFNYQYAWSYIDLKTDNYEINLLKPNETAAIRPIFFYNNRLDDNLKDTKKIFLWSTMNTIKKVDLFYTPAHVDALINEKGVHIGHEYFGYPTCENHTFYNNNGIMEIYPTFDAQLEYIAKKRADGLIWSPVMAELGDYWKALKDVTISYHNDGTITVTNSSATDVNGVTFLTEDNIRSVIIDNSDLVSFGEPYGQRTLVLPTIPAGNSVMLRINYGTKDTSLPKIISNDDGKNKVNEITAYWSNAKKTLFMTAAARSGRHSFMAKVPVFADKMVTVTKTNPGTAVIGNYKADADGKISFAVELKSVHTFELKSSSAISSTLSITSPIGGENWGAGSRQTLKWTSSRMVGDIKIEYSSDKGGSWHVITAAAPNNGSYSWLIPPVASARCLIRISGAADGTPAHTLPNTFTILNIPPQISLNYNQLNFGAQKSGPQTPSQSLLINNGGGGILDWSIQGNVPWLQWTPLKGKNNGTVTISVDPTTLLPGTYKGIITVSAPNAANSPQLVNISLNVYDMPTTDPVIGSFDTPQETNVYGCVAFTGWALDKIGVENVKLYREEGQAHVYIGDALFVEGARPDVVKAYPNYPCNYRAGWGYMMLTNFLPNAGNGVFKIQAIAANKEGKQFIIGSKTINVNNAGAIKPFGTIDTPAQGGVASGANFRISGWVLTPMPNSIPTNGSTISIYIDGVYVGHPVYNIYRADIAGLFPGCANSSGAHAYLDIDTTVYSNGIHQVYWIVTDSAGNSEGIGSRFFTIKNIE